LATSGMDYSIKFWDIRNLSTPVDGIFNNSHWIWNLKFNKTYARIFVTCSSSSLVRGYLFDLIKEENNSFSDFGFSDIDFSSRKHMDYLEFEDSVYDFDWSNNDPWLFAAISFNGYLHFNIIPQDIKHEVLIN
jgi:WD40 repeat protein